MKWKRVDLIFSFGTLLRSLSLERNCSIVIFIVIYKLGDELFCCTLYYNMSNTTFVA